MSQITDQRLTDAELSDTIDIHVSLGADGEDRTLRALRELQERRQRDAIVAELLGALKDVRKRIEDSDWWWMDCPDKGGFDTAVIDSAIKLAEEAGL